MKKLSRALLLLLHTTLVQSAFAQAPVTPANASTPASLANGGSYMCAISQAGVLKCWGENTYGQLGDGTRYHRTTPTVIDPGVSYASVFILNSEGSPLGGGFSHYGTPSDFRGYSTYAITRTGILKAWGYNAKGQLGDGTTDNRNSPVVIDAGTTYKTVVAHESQIFNAFLGCGITSADQLKCWGNGRTGYRINVGDGTELARLTPVVIDAGTQYQAISIQSWGAKCGITSGGFLKCWGNSAAGPGDGTSALALRPVAVDPGTTYKDVSTGFSGSCAVTTSGQLKCWGLNDERSVSRSCYSGVGVGALGTGNVPNPTTPQVIMPGESFSRVYMGYTLSDFCTFFSAVTALSDNGTIYMHRSFYPIPLSRLSTEFFAQPFSIPNQGVNGTAYQGVGYGLGNGGAVQSVTWGGMNNRTGVLGLVQTSIFDVGTGYRMLPIPYAGFATTVGSFCGVTSTGGLKCWGVNTYGQLGDGSTVSRQSAQFVDVGTVY